LGTLTMMPLVPETRTPASKPSLEMVIGLVMVTAPKPPGSRTLISPAGAVFEIAPAKVLQGAVRLQGLASSPTPETQVRVACAWAGTLATTKTTSIARTLSTSLLFIGSSSTEMVYRVRLSYGQPFDGVKPKSALVIARLPRSRRAVAARELGTLLGA